MTRRIFLFPIFTSLFPSVAEAATYSFPTLSNKNILTGSHSPSRQPFLKKRYSLIFGLKTKSHHSQWRLLFAFKPLFSPFKTLSRLKGLITSLNIQNGAERLKNG